MLHSATDDTMPEARRRHSPESGDDAQALPDMFDLMVVSDDDLIGRVAYSIYEQHRNDWRAEFKRLHRRPPNAHEEITYALGENTRRRMIDYRYLAEARLAGRLATRSASESFIIRSLRKAMAQRYRNA